MTDDDNDEYDSKIHLSECETREKYLQCLESVDFKLWTRDTQNFRFLKQTENVDYKETDKRGTLFTWEDGDRAIRFWKNERNDFYICMENENVFILVENLNGHPFVESESFMFYNSDGSTDAPEFPAKDAITAESIAELAKKLANEYLLRQKH